MTKIWVLVGLALSIGLGVFTYVEPENYRAVLSPIGVFMLGAIVVLYSPAFLSIFSTKPLYGGTLLGSALVLIAVGLAAPTIRNKLITSCPVMSDCWYITNSIIVTVLVFAVVLALLAAVVPSRLHGQGVPWLWLGAAIGTGLLGAVWIVLG